MTSEDIIRMAREAGLVLGVGGVEWTWDEIKRFANLVAAAEREECAVVAFNAKTYIEAAKAIRARGQE